jgi:hypothetical protein
MATTAVIEEERGTYVGTITHPHNGYYAGDFRTARRDERLLAIVAHRTTITSTSS